MGGGFGVDQKSWCVGAKECQQYSASTEPVLFVLTVDVTAISVNETVLQSKGHHLLAAL